MNTNISALSATEYKKYHESFMANNHGSSALHTFLCIFFTVQCSLCCCLTSKLPAPLQYVYEYCIIVCPMIIVHTILVNYIYFLNFVVFLILLIKLLYHYPNLHAYNSLTTNNISQCRKVLSISCLRGLTYLITVFAILAVDFRNFPRYLAKTEKHGYSLMDTGVGLFVLMSGLVHKDLHNMKLTTILKGNAKFILVLLCLGISRFVFIQQLDYQEHVTEYGVHWNFFFTLAVCKLLSSLILWFCNYACISSFIILLTHECLLHSGLEEWVFSDRPRNNVIDANREGIASCLGYVALYLFAAFIKSIISDSTVKRYKIQMKLLFLSGILSILVYKVNSYRPTSRCLANAGYCLYLEAVLVFIIMVMYTLEVIYHRKDLQFHVPVILSDINNNGLIYFLIANLLTGAINLSMRTLAVPIYGSFIVLNMYMILTIILVAYLNKKGIKI